MRQREVVVELRRPRLRVAFAVVVVAGREDRRQHAIEDLQGPLGGFPLRIRILVAVPTTAADRDVVLLHEIALVHDQPDVPSLTMFQHPFRHQIKVRLVLGVLGVVLGIGENHDGPTRAGPLGGIDQVRGGRRAPSRAARQERGSQQAL